MQLLKSSLALYCLLATAQIAAGSEDKFASGLALFNKHSYVEALRLFNETTSSGDREAQRLYYCALCYLHTAQSKKANELLQRICKNFPGSEAAGLSEKYLKASSSGELASSAARAGSIPAEKSAAESREVSIPFRKTAKGQLTVSAELQGRSMNMIFDTGAEVCLFGHNQIEAANLGNAEQSRSAILNSVAGPMRVFQIVADIKLGVLKRKLPVCVQDQNMEAGILGQPFLEGYSCVVDNQAGLIRLRRNGSTAGSAPLDSFAIPFILDGDKIIVSAELKGRSINMCFDTGSFGVCLSKSQCEYLGLKIPDTPPERTHGPNGLQVPSWQIIADLSLGPIRKRSFPIRVIDSEISYPLLGQNFFGDRTYSIDRNKKEIRFAR